jgi:DnaA family protein
LPLRLPTAAGFARFIDAGNAEAVAALKRWALGVGVPHLFVHGGPGCGKSHLLQAAAAEGVGNRQALVYLPLDRPHLTPAIFDDLEGLDAVILDAVDAVAGVPLWEEALFDLYNRLRDRGRRLLTAARVPPSRLPLGLDDLRSRLAAAAVYGLRPLDDDGRARLLREGAGRRGLALSDQAVAYMLRRCPRDPGWLLRFLDRLDHASLAAQRAPTLQLIGRLLAETPPVAPSAAAASAPGAPACARDPPGD